jgi:hypothetical protein
MRRFKAFRSPHPKFRAHALISLNWRLQLKISTSAPLPAIRRLAAIRCILFLPRRALKYLVTNIRIHALDCRSLTSLEHRVLGLGSHFIPSIPSPSFDSLLPGFNKFERTARCALYFSTTPTFPRPSDSDSGPTPRALALPSSWIPPPLNAGYQAALDSIKQSTARLTRLSTTSKPPHFNLSRRMRTTLRSLLDDKSIVICNSDKNLGLTLASSTLYREHLESWLFNKSLFAELSPTALARRIPYIITKLKSLASRLFDADSREFKGITANATTSASLSPAYILWKLHKPSLQSRLICPSPKDSILHNASAYISDILSPIVRKTRFHCSSSIQFIREIESLSFSRYSADVVLGSADAVSLYPSIPINDGLLLVKSFLFSHFLSDFKSEDSLSLSTLMDLLRLILLNNLVRYRDTSGTLRSFLQVTGTAMGTPAAVVFACLFMSALEYPIISRALDSGKLLYYTRYIDDSFLIAPSSSDYFKVISDLRRVHQAIKFTATPPRQACVFLDVLVYVGPRFPHRLDYDLYQKQLNRYLYLPFSSAHSISSKAAFIRAELQRYATHCSCHAIFKAVAWIFKTRLIRRGYPPSFVSANFKRVSYSHREPIIKPHNVGTRTRRHSHLRRRKQKGQRSRLLLPLQFSQFTASPVFLSLLNIWPHNTLLRRPMVAYSNGKSIFRLARATQVSRFS